MATSHPIPGRGRFQDLTGQTFNRLTVVALEGKNGQGCMVWLCRCDCGGTARVTTGSLKGGNTKSCGCLNRERFLRDCRQTKHGGWATPEWYVWDAMLARCGNPKHAAFHNYGDRGIRVCQRWRESFAHFLTDMGQRPSDKHSLDRIDNNRGYDCGHCEDCQSRSATANCRWATVAEQSSNKRTTRRIAFNGETLTLAEWARKVGISAPLLHHRLKSGWTVEEALTKPASKSANSRHRRKPSI